MGRTKKKMTEQELIAYRAQIQLHEYVKANIKRLPNYWQEKGAQVCIDGIRCMVARGKHTDEEIAEFYGCHVSVVDMVRVGYAKTVNKLKKEHEEMAEAYGELYTETTLKNADREGVLSLLEHIVERRNYED